MVLRPLEFSHIIYNADSVWSRFLAYSSFLPIVIAVSIITIVLFNRELEAGYLAGGLLTNAVVNFVLKHTLRQPRPLGWSLFDHASVC